MTDGRGVVVRKAYVKVVLETKLFPRSSSMGGVAFKMMLAFFALFFWFVQTDKWVSVSKMLLEALDV